MLVLADRLFYGYDMWRDAVATGAKLLWRVKSNLRLPCEVPLADGSYLSTVYASDTDRRHQRNGMRVRVIEYRLEGVPDAEPQYRLITNLLDAAVAPAIELAALYHRRWKIEEMFDEIKTHLCDGKKVLRSKTPDLVRQEFYALMLTHAAIRRLMYEAAQDSGQRPEDLSFVHAVRVLNRRLPKAAAVPP
ncbi:IS4 family transposase ISCARN35 [Paraburkholderia aspalathi]|nr:IS4 family transposase ISCARN35 [Paraburkholderia aspalathi]